MLRIMSGDNQILNTNFVFLIVAFRHWVGDGGSSKGLSIDFNNACIDVTRASCIIEGARRTCCPHTS